MDYLKYMMYIMLMKAWRFNREMVRNRMQITKAEEIEILCNMEDFVTKFKLC